MIKAKGGGDPVWRGPVAKAVTKSPKGNIVTSRNTPEKGGDRRTGKGKAPSPPPAGVGRPKIHATAADRQRAYRERQKGKA